MMLGLPEALAGMMLIALVLYAVLAGADFGGGIWDLLASGPRAKAQRALIERALAPVWEANHVWLILVVVILFSGFPRAFSQASVELHIPLTIMLLGIVFRGSAFVFRHYDDNTDAMQRRWGRVFSIASIVSPFFLGVCVGAVTNGAMTPSAVGFSERFIAPWTDGFSLCVGVFGLSLFAFLAAVYLTLEAAAEPEVREDFRRRALASGVISLVVAIGTALWMRERVAGAWWSWLLGAVAGAIWISALISLFKRRYALARVLTIAVVVLVLAGWAAAQYPYLINRSVTIRGAAAPDATLRLLLIALGTGAFVLVPSLVWLLRVFKRSHNVSIER